ncbi:hypothetical protein Bca101_082186 [Brassica carinata]
MASWNSIPLEISYEIVGWIAFTSWSISFYPQLILNFRRKSVVGLNFDFVLLNLTKHSSYMIYNVCLYFSPIIQKQYFDTYGDQEMIPVAANDVAFSIHAVVMTALTLFQIFIYEVSLLFESLSVSFFLYPAVSLMVVSIYLFLHCFTYTLLALAHHHLQVGMTCVKYIPQAKMNFTRKSTVGWSIGNILLDFGGGLANYLQMVIQSIDQNSWVNFYGNIGKTLLSLISIFFDILFMFQHYVLYPEKKASKSVETGEESNEPLMDPSHEHV